MGYLKYILKRLFLLIPILILITLTIFLLESAMGIPPAKYLLVGNPNITPENVFQESVRLGLIDQQGKPRPMLIQYLYWLKALFQGEFGWSLRHPNYSALELFLTFLPNSLLMIIPSIFLSLIISILVGVKSAYRQNSRFDRISMILSSLGLSIPPYWLALLAIIIFCVVPYRLFNFSLFPAGNIISFGKPFAGSFWDRIWHLALPVLVLSVTFVATWTRYMRSSFLEVIRSDFIRTALAKGVSERGIIWKHALRNALIPLVTTVAVSIPWVFTWAIVVETVFSYPGLCRLFYESFFYPTDVSVLQLVVFFFLGLTVFCNLLADTFYWWLDPRIREQRAAGGK